MKPGESPLPYTDTKPVGAADFYLAINATFRFILARFGIEGLRRYWRELGESYYLPVAERWKRTGLRGVADYWRSFFEAEPGGEVEVSESDGAVCVDVKKCPAIAHLRAQGREIVPCFCQHCYFVSEAIAAPAGLRVRITGGNGACVQRFFPRTSGAEPQRIEEIVEAA